MDSDAGEVEPSLTSKMLVNPDVDEDDDDDDEYVFEEQDSRTTDATGDEEDMEASTAAVLSELAELRQEKHDNGSDPTKRHPFQSAPKALLPESEDEAVETDVSAPLFILWPHINVSFAERDVNKQLG
ncbi:hypothetical protein BDZ89DRAFT_1058433, partial [Hymenopellis radicata]